MPNQNPSSADGIPRTSEVPFFSSLHGRERRALRGIDKTDLQAAVLHGTKEPGWPHPATGAIRWVYRYGGIVYVTDESSTQEITSYAEPIDIPRADLTEEHILDHEAAKDRLRVNPSLCTSHTVIVVDQSASMKTCDIFDFRNRSMAVFGMLALNFVATQRLSGEATDTDVVSLVLMRDVGEVVFEREPMGMVLYNRFVDLHDEGTPRSHGNYLPALDAVEDLLNNGAHTWCALSLLFLSDGRPSDHSTSFADGSSYDDVVDLITDRVSDLAELYGQQLSVSTMGFASRDQDFCVLEAMAGAARDAGAQGEFHRPGLSSEGLGTAIARSVSSLTATRQMLTSLAVQGGQRRERRQVGREAACSESPEGWTEFSGHMGCVTRYVYSSEATRDYGNPWVAVNLLSDDADGFAIRVRASGEGAERLVFGLREIDSRGKQTRFVGPKLVAKESCHVGDGYGEERKLGFHRSFAKTQLKAKRLATKFNTRVRERLNIRGLSTSRVWDVSFVDCSVYVFEEHGIVVRAVLAEKLLVPPNCYIKWNGNNGYVHSKPLGSAAAEGPSRVHPIVRRGFLSEDEELDPYDFSRGSAPPQQQQQHTLGLGGIEEEDEYEESDCDDNSSNESDDGEGEQEAKAGLDGPPDGGARGLRHDSPTGRPIARSFAPEAECYPQAFSHFTYRHTHRKALVCDLQGVLSNSTAGEDRAGVFELTDPAIHYRSTSGRDQVYGKTDLGKKGVDKFFETHQCNDVCRLLGLGK